MTFIERLLLATLCLVVVAALTGCAHTREVPVTKEIPVEVKVPVSAPCVAGQKPDEVVALRDKMTRQEWASLSTDQREKLLGAQGLDRKAYGDKLTVATAGCR